MYPLLFLILFRTPAPASNGSLRLPQFGAAWLQPHRRCPEKIPPLAMKMPEITAVSTSQRRTSPSCALLGTTPPGKKARRLRQVRNPGFTDFRPHDGVTSMQNRNCMPAPRFNARDSPRVALSKTSSPVAGRRRQEVTCPWLLRLVPTFWDLNVPTSSATIMPGFKIAPKIRALSFSTSPNLTPRIKTCNTPNEHI